MRIFGAFFAVFFTVFTHGQSMYIDTAKQNVINHGAKFDPYLSSALSQKNRGFINGSSHIPESEIKETDKFKIDTITKAAFNKYKKKYKTRINTDSSKVIWTDTSFIIKTGTTEQNYNTELTSDEGYAGYYSGFLEPLNLYIVVFSDLNNEVGDTYLIDKKTGKHYFFESPIDYPLGTVCISPKCKYIMAYGSFVSPTKSYISIFTINSSKNSFTLKDFYGLYLNGTEIIDLVWVNETSFAIEATAGYSDENYPLPNVFLKATFKE